MGRNRQIRHEEGPGLVDQEEDCMVAGATGQADTHHPAHSVRRKEEEASPSIRGGLAAVEVECIGRSPYNLSGQ